ncbi:uncharacterized protein LOC124124556 isoform X2 [Haliotis rufescens]|uniref:uncharacterized protein LOC124124556 isoform X2 n=1 Tax=Haliotis rufescens TaxID=6454 RepID=UPI00201EAC56|nr:uncharacterized protein LOC124124556 isoform X2 [Haliotis rufescens]
MMAWKVKQGDYLELENCTDSSDEDHGVRDAGPRKDRKKLLMRLSHLQPTDRNSLCWDEFFGSSLDLAPTLLTIYDTKAAATGSTEQSSVDHPDVKSKSMSLPASATVRQSRGVVVRTDSDPKITDSGSKMTDIKVRKEDLLDGDTGKKRPLSISSSSSASSSSLSRPQHKRPNLAEYEHLLSSSNVDNTNSKREDINGNCPDSGMDYNTSSVQNVEKMDGIDETPSPEGERCGASGTNYSIKTAVVDKLELSRCTSPVIGPLSSSVSIPLPSISPESSPEKLTLSASSSPSDSPVRLDTGHRSVSTAGSEKSAGKYSGQTRTKSPPPSLGAQLSSSPSGRSRSSPASPKSPSGAKDTGSPDSNKGSLYVTYVQRVVAEIVDTERTYVKSLEDIIQGYLEYLEKLSLNYVKEEDLKCLFSNIRDIYDFGRLFLWEVEKCDGNPVQVAECFVKNNEGFVIYTDYCTNYPSAVEVLTRYMMDPHMSELFKQRQVVLGHGLQLGAYLLRPVQRILKYHLLLQNILKFFDKDKTGYETLNKAFKHMTEMAHHINEMKRKHEHAVRIQEIQSQLEEYGGEDLIRLGELVLEGPFRVYGAKASRQVFLFEREILISKKKEGGMLGCKASIQLANLMLVEVIPNEPLSFHLIPFDNPRAQFTLQARNMEQKRRWCQEIKRLILETYKGKIPDKVKSLVMELGRNHDDDYVNSENLDPRRSHHTAPEYLERRRGRRKSGGRLPDLLKPQKGKRGSSGNRKGDISPRTSPLLERRQTHSSLETSVARETTPDHKKSKQSVTDTSSEGASVSRATTQSDISSQSAVIEDTSVGFSRSVDTLAGQKNTSPKETSSDNVRRAKSFRIATRMRPINSLDLGDVIPSIDSDSESDVDDPDLTQDGLKDYNDVVFNSRSDLDELSDGDKPKKTNKQSRYTSMPILNITPPSKDSRNSPKESGTVNSNSWTKNKQGSLVNLQTKQWTKNGHKEQGKSIPAFHDTFAKRSRENLTIKALRHPVYTVKHLSVDCDASSMKGINAKLTNWGSTEKLTKGSMTDVSHLSEDPWVKNPAVKKLSGSVSVSNVSVKPQVNKQKKTSEPSDPKSGSRENMDWRVYVNRNSLNDTENQKYFSKYCTPPRGTMTPPKSPVVMKQEHNSQNPMKQNTNDSPCNLASRPVSTYDTVPDIPKVTVASSVPSIIVSSTSPKFPHHDHLSRHNLNRSNSTPLTKTKTIAQAANNRPSSFDCEGYTDSERMVAEMEDYMRKSRDNNSSSSCKFPTNLPVFHYNEFEKGNRHSNISTSSYESHSSSSSEGIMDTLKHKIHSWTSKISKRMEDSDGHSTLSSVSDVRPSSLLMSDDEKMDDAKSKNSSCETLDSPHARKRGTERLKRQHHLLEEDEELRIFLRQRGLGGDSIGSRMANSLPPNVEALITDKLRPHSACVLRDSDSLSSYELSSKETTPEPQARLSLPILPPAAENHSPLLNKMEIQQSDSGFSMQSDETDSNSMETTAAVNNMTPPPAKQMDVEETEQEKDETPTLDTRQKESTVSRGRTQSESSADSVDSFYERRLSIAFDSEVFQDSAVFCDVNIDPKQKVVKETPKKPRQSIKDFVQILEERNKPKTPHTVEVKRRGPGSVIRQRLQTLQQASQYSRHSSRNTSEERELVQPKSVKDIQQSLVTDSRSGQSKSWHPSSSSNIGSINSSSNTSISSSCSSGISGPHFAVVGGSGSHSYGGNQFMHHHVRAESEHGRESSPELCGLRSARSLGRLDQLSTDIENLVIMKGWVRSLINKFQSDKE